MSLRIPGARRREQGYIHKTKGYNVKEIRLSIEELEPRIAPSIAPGLQGYEGQPGNQRGHGSNGSNGTPNGLRGYEGQPGNQGG